MKRILYFTVVLVSLLINFTAYSTGLPNELINELASEVTVKPSTELSTKEVVKRSDQQMRGESGYNEITMNIIRPEWSRSMSMKLWSKGNRAHHFCNEHVIRYTLV